MAWRTWGLTSWKAWSVPFSYSTSSAWLAAHGAGKLCVHFTLSSLSSACIVPPQNKASPFISPLKHVLSTHCVLYPLCAVSKGPRREEHLVYKMRREADDGVGCPRLSKNLQSCLGSPKAKRRIVKPNMMLCVPPLFPNKAPSPLLNAPLPSSPNNYLGIEARGTLESCNGRGPTWDLPWSYPSGLQEVTVKF